MDAVVLALTRLLLLALLYLFLWRVVRVMAADLRAPTAPRAAAARGRTATRPGTRAPAAEDAEARPPPVGRRAASQLVVHEPSGAVTTVDLGQQTVVLGRAPTATVVVEDEFVSDEHTAFTPTDAGWTVTDLGSTNGTDLNGAKVTIATPVSAGDQVRVGKTRVEVRR